MEHKEQFLWLVATVTNIQMAI